MQLHNSNEGEMDPNKVFEGLGLINWLKVCFRTRAGLLKQNDRILDTLMQRLYQLGQESNNNAAALKRMATLAIKQQMALQGVVPFMAELHAKLEEAELPDYTKAMNDVAAALTMANEEMKP